ncbi:MAG: hypothetical protein HRU41_18975 [Saprospiraceae bacterium]|nr:hypothetical protein [Saprospiraceae bacterium]
MRAVVEKTQRQGLVPLSLLTAADGSNYSLNGQREDGPGWTISFQIVIGVFKWSIGDQYLGFEKGIVALNKENIIF